MAHKEKLNTSPCNSDEQLLIAYEQVVKGEELLNKQSYQDALQLFSNVLSLHPDHLGAKKGAGIALCLSERHQEARPILSHCFGLDPNNEAISLHLAKSLIALKELPQALKLIKHCLSIHPESAQGNFLYGQLLAISDTPVKAIKPLVATLKIAKNNEKVVRDTTEILVKLQQAPLAIKTLEDILESQPNNIAALCALGEFYIETGESKKRLNVCKKILTLDKSRMTAYEVIAREDPDSIGDGVISFLSSIETTKLDPANPTQANQIATAYYALYNIYNHRKDYPKAFIYLEKANRIKRAHGDDRTAVFCKSIDPLCKHFSEKVLPRFPQRKTADDGSNCIFVASLPRAGSSLTEQILGSHKDITPGGEMGHLISLVGIHESTKKQDIYQIATTWDSEKLTAFGQKYLENVEKEISNPGLFTDKNPFNFPILGITLLSLPSAKVIHIKRHPLDNALGCFQQNFKRGNYFSYNLEEIGHYFNAYHKLMRYWESQFPNNFYTLYYEDLVHNTRDEVTSMLEFLDLPMDENCLEFYKNSRATKTASATQVQKPISKDRIARWKNYEKQLSPLAKIMETEINNYRPKCHT